MVISEERSTPLIHSLVYLADIFSLRKKKSLGVITSGNFGVRSILPHATLSKRTKIEIDSRHETAPSTFTA